MATGRQVQLTKQVGEYLVAAELSRRGLLTATFAGNVPAYDIVAACPHPRTNASARLRDPDDLPGVHRKVLHGVVEAPKRVTVKPWISTRVSSVAKSSRASTASASATARDRSASRSAFVGVSSGANSRWRWREAGVPPRPLPEAWYCQVEPDGRF